MAKRALNLILSVCVFVSYLGPIPQVQAQGVAQLPVPGTMVNLSPAFEPVLIKGLKIDTQNPFAFDFIVDSGNTSLSAQDPALKEESNKLIKYFLAALTIPEKDLWVNLSPYEKDRMVADNLGQTDMGRDLLAQDYILKQLTASLIYPEKELGKAFWDKIYAQAEQRFGTAEIPVNTFNKVWIVADKADVLERGNTAFVTGAHLKVMLEEDYLAKDKNKMVPGTILSNQIVRDVIIPAIEKEINEGKNFAPLRQMYYSMILASWYKMALKESLLSQVYGNKSKVKAGINAKDLAENEKIYERYLESYKKGVFNYVKEVDSTPRKYFSGGAKIDASIVMRRLSQVPQDAQLTRGNLAMVSGPLAIKVSDNTNTAMVAAIVATMSEAKINRLIEILESTGYGPDKVFSIVKYVSKNKLTESEVFMLLDLLADKLRVSTDTTETARQKAQWLLDAAWLTALYNLDRNQFEELRDNLENIKENSKLNTEIPEKIDVLIQTAKLLYERWQGGYNFISANTKLRVRVESQLRADSAMNNSRHSKLYRASQAIGLGLVALTLDSKVRLNHIQRLTEVEELYYRHTVNPKNKDVLFRLNENLFYQTDPWFFYPLPDDFESEMQSKRTKFIDGGYKRLEAKRQDIIKANNQLSAIASMDEYLNSAEAFIKKIDDFLEESLEIFFRQGGEIRKYWSEKRKQIQESLERNRVIKLQSDKLLGMEKSIIVKYDQLKTMKIDTSEFLIIAQKIMNEIDEYLKNDLEGFFISGKEKRQFWLKNLEWFRLLLLKRNLFLHLEQLAEKNLRTDEVFNRSKSLIEEIDEYLKNNLENEERQYWLSKRQDVIQRSKRVMDKAMSSSEAMLIDSPEIEDTRMLGSEEMAQRLNTSVEHHRELWRAFFVHLINQLQYPTPRRQFDTNAKQRLQLFSMAWSDDLYEMLLSDLRKYLVKHGVKDVEIGHSNYSNIGYFLEWKDPLDNDKVRDLTLPWVASVIDLPDLKLASLTFRIQQILNKLEPSNPWPLVQRKTHISFSQKEIEIYAHAEEPLTTDKLDALKSLEKVYNIEVNLDNSHYKIKIVSKETSGWDFIDERDKAKDKEFILNWFMVQMRLRKAALHFQISDSRADLYQANEDYVNGSVEKARELHALIHDFLNKPLREFDTQAWSEFHSQILLKKQEFDALGVNPLSQQGKDFEEGWKALNEAMLSTKADRYRQTAQGIYLMGRYITEELANKSFSLKQEDLAREANLEAKRAYVRFKERRPRDTLEHYINKSIHYHLQRVLGEYWGISHINARYLLEKVKPIIMKAPYVKGQFGLDKSYVLSLIEKKDPNLLKLISQIALNIETPVLQQNNGIHGQTLTGARKKKLLDFLRYENNQGQNYGLKFGSWQMHVLPYVARALPTSEISKISGFYPKVASSLEKEVQRNLRFLFTVGALKEFGSEEDVIEALKIEDEAMTVDQEQFLKALGVTEIPQDTNPYRVDYVFDEYLLKKFPDEKKRKNFIFMAQDTFPESFGLSVLKMILRGTHNRILDLLGLPKVFKTTILSGKKVLLVDDSRRFRQDVKYALEFYEAEVVEAEDGEEALRRIQELSGKFDLVVTDLDMPKMNGAGLLEEIGKLPQRIPVLIWSGGGQSSINQWGIKSTKEIVVRDKSEYALRDLLEIAKGLLGNAAASPAQLAMPGGIDLDPGKMQMNVTKQGQGVQMDADPAMFEKFKSGDFDGLEFQLQTITPITTRFLFEHLLK
jgi:hypothetical protein